jgi:protein-tyrosine phosphatase
MSWMNDYGSKAGCHTGNPLVFEIDGVAIHAGGHSRNGGWHRMSPMPDLAVGPAQVMDRSSQATVVPDGFSCRDNIGGGTPQIISIDWPDFSIPQDIHRDFWLALVADIKRLGIKTVSTQCVGGHGRTGVQLCILGYLMGDAECLKQPDAAALTKYVRSIYCHHAVEGKSQQQYIAEVLQIPEGESLFKSFPKQKNNFTFVDDSDMPTKKKKKNQPKADYWFEEEIDEDDGDGFPDTWRLYACEVCNHSQWKHVEEGTLGCCDECGAPEMNNATDALYDMSGICPKCDNTVSHFGMHKDGHCIVCAADEANVKTRDGFVQCKKNKKFYLPEFINTDTWVSYEGERNDRLKKEAAKKKKANKKKGKGKQPKDKAEHYPAKPKKGRKGEGKYGMNLDEWI